MRVTSLLNLSITVFTPNYSEEHEGNVKLHFFNHKMSQKLNRKKKKFKTLQILNPQIFSSHNVSFA